MSLSQAINQKANKTSIERANSEHEKEQARRNKIVEYLKTHTGFDDVRIVGEARWPMQTTEQSFRGAQKVLAKKPREGYRVQIDDTEFFIHTRNREDTPSYLEVVQTCACGTEYPGPSHHIMVMRADEQSDEEKRKRLIDGLAWSTARWQERPENHQCARCALNEPIHCPTCGHDRRTP